MDATGKIVINAQFNEAMPFVNGLARVKVSGKFGYVDTAGKYIILPTN